MDGNDEPTNVYITALNDQGIEQEVDPSKSIPNNLMCLPSIDDDQKIFEMYSTEEIENFRMIFIMFDPEKTGFVGLKDLETILKSLGRDPEEARDLVAGMPLSDDRMSFMEFLQIMKALESRLTAKEDKPEDEEEELEPIEGTLEDRNKFGALLPRTGVHFLPDSKVVDFLR